MPDIATALQTALTKWEPAPTPEPDKGPVAPYLFRVTNNVTRATFEAVRDNPGITTDALHKLMADRGYSRGSISSLISQMLTQGLVSRDENKKLWPLQAEYKSLKSGADVQKLRAQKKKAEDYARRIATRRANALKRQQAAAQAAPAPAPQAAPAPAPAPQAAPLSVDDILNTLSVLQARALYVRLQELFA